MGAGVAWTLAALPDSQAPKLVALARADIEKRAAQARLRAAITSSPEDGVLFEREALAAGIETLRSLAALWPATGPAVEPARARFERLLPRPRASSERDPRIPVRNAEVRGPLLVYYYDHLSEILGPGAEALSALLRRENGELLAYETLNLVDGKRTVSGIRDILSGRYAPVPLTEIAEYLQLLARAQVVQFK
jgi:hypothetical protein